ncbi:MAG: DUF11 domain-containing protein [Chryseobacterium sp.]|jgi:uncharacterized repeat protein (TIGR01451 family)|uniref:hypothetical protein n=1 Tax=Chryseobacterium sp. TaxID=1871047 RepID=UPI0028197D23|nr:hypothetical protein [Chryseobacterium sp.]MDR2234728.1 DUF11 domain-containing protein [Chryseobacterium sp.]
MKYNLQLRTVIALVCLLCSGWLFADGSRDLYPSGVTGYRAFLRSSNTTTESWPFANEGIHYVYAKAGERITLASSAQNGGTGRIRLFAPDGTQVVNNTTAGQINNRAAELAGPQLFGQSVAGRYLPIYHAVTEEGIYRVEFVGRAGTDPSTTVAADASWSQSSTNAGIAAWDVSVINAGNTGFVQGRVYTNILNLSNGTSSPNTDGFYGLVYVLTKDGYTYRVNNNGNNGLYFTFFANNNGFVDPATQDPVYKSLSQSTTAFLTGRVHNPNLADTPKHITHKLFYSLPASDLPATASGAVPGGSTWMKNSVIVPDVTGVQLVGVDGTPAQVSGKGGYIKFTAGTQGQYKIVIQSSATPAAFTTRTLTGPSIAGTNSIFWDGKDGSGNALPTGSVPAEVTVQLQGAEVHFPFFDMEYNRNGTIIQLLNHTNLSSIVSDLVYWNDVDVPDGTSGTNAPRGRYSDPKNNTHLPPVNSNGISSTTNGHIWGQGGTGTSGLFGDVRSIDTWTFVKGNASTITTSVEVKVADLKVTQVMPDKSAVSSGESLTYTVKVKNDGPSDVTGAPFTFTIPEGLDPQSFVFTGNGCGSESVAMTYNPATRTYSSSLNLPNGCEITYKFVVMVTSSATAGNLVVKAGILRPNDVTDPDATNPNPAVPPTNAEYECANNGQGGICNNLLNNNSVLFSPAPICTEDVLGNAFSTSDGTPVTFSQPATDFGFVFDIYTLDNSFSLNINGGMLANQEIQFATALKNIRFADGSSYGTGGVPEIWQITGTPSAPSIRVNISATGAVTLLGSKTSGGPLFPMELYNGATFNTVTWNIASANIVTATQVVTGPTYMTGYGSGKKIVPCHCIKPGATGTPDSYAKVGILTKPSITVANWPKNVPNGQLVLDSAGKGLVITHMTTAQRDAMVAVEGMIIYNTDLKCVQLYRGTAPGADTSRTGWNCIKRGCNE